MLVLGMPALRAVFRHLAPSGTPTSWSSQRLLSTSFRYGAAARGSGPNAPCKPFARLASSSSSSSSSSPSSSSLWQRLPSFPYLSATASAASVVVSRSMLSPLTIAALCVSLKGFAAPRYLLPNPVSCHAEAASHEEFRPIRRGNYRHEKKQHREEIKVNWGVLWTLLRPDLFLLCAAILSALGAAFVNVQIPIMIGKLVNAITAGAGVKSLTGVAVQVATSYLVQALFTATYIFTLGMVGERLADRMRKRLFDALVKQDLAFFDARQSGEIVSRLAADVQEFKSSFKQIVSVGVRNVAQTAGSIVSMYLVSPQLTGYLLVLVPVVIGIGTLLGSTLRKLSRKANDAKSQATGMANEVLSNIATVRAFGMEQRETDEYSHLSAGIRRLSCQLAFGIGVFTGGSHLFLNSVILSVIYYGGILMSKDMLTPGDLMRFLVSAQTIQRALSNTSVLFGQVVRGATAGNRVFEYINMKPSIPTKGGLIPDTLKGDIEFAHVTFAYPSRAHQEVLRHFSLHVPAGKMVALCGPSGAGKSTIVKLLERFYDPREGAVLIDGVPVAEYDPTWLRQHAIGYINQEPVLFATSVLENIRYGCPSATEDEVYEAAKKANAHQFICSFPDGYNTMIGERGTTVSGGQKQRIAIARAILKDPKILILDEATSALDAESEKLVQSAIDNLTKGRTVIVIAHRLSTIQSADEIAVVQGGVVVEQGTHRQLLRKRGIYADLVRHQISNEGGVLV